MSLLVGTRRVLLGGVARVKYLLRATFNATDQGFADGQVLDDPSEGVQDGQLTVVEVDGTLAIVSNKCALTAQGTPSWGDQGFYSQAITRALGRGLLWKVNVDATNTQAVVGWHDSGAVPDPGTSMYIARLSSAGTIKANVDSTTENVHLVNYSASTNYEFALMLGGYDAAGGLPWRSGQAVASYLYGVALYIEGGVFTDWTLLWRSSLDNTATLYAALSNYNKVGTLNDFRVPDRDLSAVLQPTCLSLFTGDNATDLDALTPEVGGVWTEQSGDWEVSANQIVATTDNTEHIATVDSGISDAMIDCVVEISTDTGGLEHGIVLRFSDTSTYWKVSINATNNDVGIWEINAGVTERANGAVTINTSTDYAVRAIADGQTIDAFVDGGAKISYGSAANNENETEHGLYTYFNVGADFADFDNFAVFARTSSVYDSALNAV